MIRRSRIFLQKSERSYEMKKLLNGALIVSARHNSYGGTQANGRTKRLYAYGFVWVIKPRQMFEVQHCHSTLGHSPHMQANTHKTCIFQKKYTTFVPSNCPSPMKYRFADIVIDSSSHCVMRRTQVVRLTNIEFRLLEYLAQNADHICSREDILNHVWGSNFSTTRAR